MSGNIKGLRGSFEVLHWHVGDDVRITVHGGGGSIPMVTDALGVRLWVNAFQGQPGSGTFIIRTQYAIGEVTRVDDEFYVYIFDIDYPNLYRLAIFNLDQAEQIITALTVR